VTADKLVQTRVPPKVYTRLRKLAASTGMSDAAFVRFVLTMICDGRGQVIIEDGRVSRVTVQP
jgi:predicted DNA-binding protein